MDWESAMPTVLLAGLAALWLFVVIRFRGAG